MHAHNHNFSNTSNLHRKAVLVSSRRQILHKAASMADTYARPCYRWRRVAPATQSSPRTTKPSRESVQLGPESVEPSQESVEPNPKTLEPGPPAPKPTEGFCGNLGDTFLVSPWVLIVFGYSREDCLNGCRPANPAKQASQAGQPGRPASPAKPSLSEGVRKPHVRHFLTDVGPD